MEKHEVYVDLSKYPTWASELFNLIPIGERGDIFRRWFVAASRQNRTEVTPQQFIELCKEWYPANTAIEALPTKPQHYDNGIDTFQRMEANCTTAECLAFAKGNIDKYNFRTKGQDREDYVKIIAYANWAISLIDKEK